MVKQWRHQGCYKQRVRCVPFRRANSVIMPSISITSLCLCICRLTTELNLSSVVVLHKGEATLSCACWYRISQQSYESPDIYSRIELELAQSKVSTKVCGFRFRSISLHLIRKRIKEILAQKHQYNAKYLSQFNDKNASGNKKNLYIFSRFQLYA